jgi:ectoine hydroxylase-related dioxygenase (phytanoyl-CoA dioxygenase family)
MKLAASWLALEDIKPGTGELEYYVGSHRAPDFLFAGEHKWLEAAPHEHDKFLASLHEDASKYGFQKSSFLGDEGDVLIWHADLAHGGGVITKPDSTRQSLVTHFTPKTLNPPYARNGGLNPIEEHGCQFISVPRVLPLPA